MAARRRVRGNIEKLPSGNYRAIVYAGVDPLTGREHRLRETCQTVAANLEIGGRRDWSFSATAWCSPGAVDSPGGGSALVVLPGP